MSETVKTPETEKPKKEATSLHPDQTPDSAELSALQAVDKPAPGALVPGEVSGEVGGSDIKMPVLRIMQKMSDNPAKLDNGTITVNGDIVVEGEDGAIVTVVSIQKKYEEVVPFGTTPQRFERLEEAIQKGFKLCRSKQDRESGVPLVEESAMVLLACHQPEGAMDRSFPFDIAGTRCIPAMWFLRSYAYGSIAKTIFSKLAFDLRDTELLEARWKITTEERKNSYGVFYVPQIVLQSETNSKEFVEALKKQVNFA